MPSGISVRICCQPQFDSCPETATGNGFITNGFISDLVVEGVNREHALVSEHCRNFAHRESVKLYGSSFHIKISSTFENCSMWLVEMHFLIVCSIMFVSITKHMLISRSIVVCTNELNLVQYNGCSLTKITPFSSGNKISSREK